MELKKKTLIIILLLAMMGFYSYTKSKPKKIIKTIPLKEKVAIIDKAKFNLKPTIIINKDDISLTIDYDIISYQNPELIQLNYDEQSMLEINEHLINVEKIKIIEETKYNLKSTIQYNISNLKNINTIKLNIFTYTNSEFIWNINESSKKISKL